jgi:hypothetical protein
MEKRKSFLKKEIRTGRITSIIKGHLRKKVQEIETIYPNSWDLRFAKTLIYYPKQLSSKQIIQLERILSHEILKEEYPNGFEDFVIDAMNTIEVKEFNEKICNNSEDEVKNEMIELYNNLSNTENEDVYLSDGVWLRPDGTMYDEKSSH